MINPLEYYYLPGYSLVYTNRVGRETGGVVFYISNDVKYNLRQDVCKANSHFDSVSVEIENDNIKKL